MRRLSKYTMSLFLGLALTSAAPGQNKLTNVTADATNEYVTIRVEGDNLPQPREAYVRQNRVFIAEFSDTILAGRGRYITVRKRGVLGVNVIQYNAKTKLARVTLRFSTPQTAKVTQSPNGWTITVGAQTAAVDLSKAGLVLSMPTSKLKVEAVQTKEAVQVKKEDFPLTVPPIEPVAAVNTKTNDAKPITLNFVGADIVFILKALAEQAGTNIVTAPDVRGALTVSLKNVSVEQALDLVTKLAGYRYARMNNTWVVGTGDFLTRMLVQSDGNTGGRTIMKVVPLASRKAGEIKRAIVKALSLDQLSESLRIIHPLSDANDFEVPPVSLGDVNAEAGSPAAKQGTGGATPPAGKSSTLEGDADYLILVGQKSKIDQAVLLINQLDSALAGMAGVSGGADAFAPITVPYIVRGGKAEDLAKAVAGVSGGVTVMATPGTSRAGQTLVLRGRPGEVSRLMAMLEQIDNVSPDGELTFFVYEVKFADPRALKDQLSTNFETLQVAVGPQGVSGRSYRTQANQGGAAIAQGTGTGVAAAGGAVGASSGPTGSPSGTSGTTGGSQMLNAAPIYTQYETEAVPMRLVLSGSKSMIDRALAFLAQVDKPLPQIAIEARVVEMSKEDIIKAGFDWNIMTGGALSMLRFNNSQESAANSGTLNITSGNRTAAITGSLDRLINKNNVLSRPNVVAMDGREAVVFIGDVVRFVRSVNSGTTGTSIEIGEEEVGVKLNVLPRVGVDNMITLDVQPTVSFIKSFLPTGNGGQVPTTSVRTVRNTMRIADGETFAIGGLISEDDRRSVQGVPILMDLPLVGQLFRKTTNTKTKTEIVIFVTARVIQGPAMSSPQSTRPPSGKGGKAG